MPEGTTKINEKNEQVETPPDFVDEYTLHLPRPLNLEEKKYLLAVERGDLRKVRKILQNANRPSLKVSLFQYIHSVQQKFNHHDNAFFQKVKSWSPTW